MKTFILTAMLALTAVSGVVVLSDPAAANCMGYQDAFGKVHYIGCGFRN